LIINTPDWPVSVLASTVEPAGVISKNCYRHKKIDHRKKDASS
jgi:hypothetical protein